MKINQISKLQVSNTKLESMLSATEQALLKSKEYNSELVGELLEMEKFKEAVEVQCETCTLKFTVKCTDCPLYGLI